MKRVFVLYNTLRHLRPRQVLWRGYRFVRLRLCKGLPPVVPSGASSAATTLTMAASVPRYRCASGCSFTFLNRQWDFSEGIDWNFLRYGKLWAYNLNYFDFLNQEDLEAAHGSRLIHDFIADLSKRSEGLEPYPTSLRIMNTVKFLCRHRINDHKIEDALFRQALHLMNNLDYHLLGNHLLENGFALLSAGLFFPGGPFCRKAEEILSAELEEQILADGGHFELSPMYHQILLDRLLDAINLVQSNNQLPELLPLLRQKASGMLGWLRQVSFAGGDIPQVNDSASGIAPATSQLFAYAQRLGVPTVLFPLGASGYRKVVQKRYEMLVDVGNIGPDYIPGHAHSDTFSFVLYVDGQPLIVETGTSTYETNARRLAERGTAAHNTVEVDSLDQSEVWGSFRVARRAYVVDLCEGPTSISAGHTGYWRIGVRHQREFRFSDTDITIIDTVSNGKVHQCRAFFHFHPSVTVVRQGEGFKAGPARITFVGSTSVEEGNFSYAPEFNRLIPAQMVTAAFADRLVTTITLPPVGVISGGV